MVPSAGVRTRTQSLRFQESSSEFELPKRQVGSSRPHRRRSTNYWNIISAVFAATLLSTATLQLSTSVALKWNASSKTQNLNFFCFPKKQWPLKFRKSVLLYFFCFIFLLFHFFFVTRDLRLLFFLIFLKIEINYSSIKLLTIK